ncbi:MAG: hypothetical protein II171_06515 [Bacteroidales bacterium]|nr:hypothetical protein [Bacteroidales bacterium]
MKTHKTLLLALCALFAACTGSQKVSVPIYVWQGLPATTQMDSLQKDYRFWKSQGVVGVCMESADLDLIQAASALAHAEGLEYHAWIPALPKYGMPHEWYAVSRLGQKADEFPAFVDSYRFLDPANPEVRDYLVNLYAAVAAIPEVDYVQLDFIRYPDVILARGLWEKYGLDMTEEYPPADYCYCDDCVAAFQARTGIDIREVEDPSKVKEWAQFRCDQITELVGLIADAVHAKGKKLSADVFPGPASHAEWMVRQQWNNWKVDMLFPMNYNDFYLGGTDWIAKVVEEEAASAPAGVPVMSGLFICPDWRNKDKVVDPEDSGLLPSEMDAAVKASLEKGAAGICLFTPGRMSPEHWDALKKALDK